MNDNEINALDSQLYKLFQESKEEGLTEEELRQLFSPLILHLNSIKSGQQRSRLTICQWKLTLVILFSLITIILIGFIFTGPQQQQQSQMTNNNGVLSFTASIIDSIVQPFVNFKNSLTRNAMSILRILLVNVLPFWNWTDLYYSRCLIKNPYFQNNELLEDDCNLCETLDEIERVSSISQSQVIEQYIKREKPFIVTDAMNGWPVMETNQFWFDNITELFLSQDNFYYVCNLNTNLRTATSTNNDGRAMTDLAKVIRKLYNPHTKQWFLHWENCQKEGAKVTRQFYRRPYFISNSLDFTGSNWVLMSSDFHGRVFKKLDVAESLSMMYQLRGSNHIRLIPKEICRGQCPELTVTLEEGEILIVTHLLWILEYIPGENGDNLAILSEVSWSAGE